MAAPRQNDRETRRMAAPRQNDRETRRMAAPRQNGRETRHMAAPRQNDHETRQQAALWHLQPVRYPTRAGSTAGCARSYPSAPPTDAARRDGPMKRENKG